jgi:hypothetical protein
VVVSIATFSLWLPCRVHESLDGVMNEYAGYQLPAADAPLDVVDLLK